jgi:hypothetical protein
MVGRVAGNALNGVPIDVEGFMKDLAEIRLWGHSILWCNARTVSMGCALLATDGSSKESLSISLPRDPMVASGERGMAEALLSTCARVSEVVGYF